jgi:Flp pilus assembly secretin CpaC
VPASVFIDPAMLTNGVVTGVMGILTSGQAKSLLQTLKARPTDTLAEPEVVTLSGRQTRVSATQIITVVTNLTYDETVTTGPLIPQTESVETGSVLDVVPKVLSDGYTIHLKTTATVTNFLGYDLPSSVGFGERIDHQGRHYPVPLPVLRVWQAGADLNLWDNQTVVLGKIQGHTFAGGKEVADKLGLQDKELLVFITVTLVDPAGNRIHSEKEMSFAGNSVPPQAGD